MVKILYISFALMFTGCKDKPGNEKNYDVRCDIRLFTKYFTLFVNTNGMAYVVKGKGSDYTDTLIVESADTSSVFKLDSFKVFFETLNRIKTSPIIKKNLKTGTAHSGEVYYKHQKIFDAYAYDTAFWDVFRPIMGQLPKGFNPFRMEDY